MTPTRVLYAIPTLCLFVCVVVLWQMVVYEREKNQFAEKDRQFLFGVIEQHEGAIHRWRIRSEDNAAVALNLEDQLRKEQNRNRQRDWFWKNYGARTIVVE